MARVKRGMMAHKRHKKLLNQAKGYQGSRSRRYAVAKQSVMKALSYAFRDRRAPNATSAACGLYASMPRLACVACRTAGSSMGWARLASKLTAKCLLIWPYTT